MVNPIQPSELSSILGENDAYGQRINLAPVPVTGHAASASVFLMEVVNWDGKPQVSRALTAAFDAEDYLECIKNLHARHIEPQLYINSLDKVGLYATRNTMHGS